ncbi:MAG: hypothetical protein JWP91_607 [Fibrobacteres bacterium]|nr:hypothetical protein [Fibrobacterota bacterium]
MDAPENAVAAEIAACSKCGLERREAKKFCPRCGFPYASVFKQPVSTLQSLEPAIKTTAALFGVNLILLFLKIAPKSIHLHIGILTVLLFDSIVLFAVYPIRSKIRFLGRRFFNAYFPPWKMISLALLTAVGIQFYFEAVERLGVPMLDYFEKSDVGTFKALWVFISAVLLAPVFEEIYFRGYLFQKFRLVLKPKENVLLQGLVFGIIHLSPATYISHTMLGILFGYFRYRTKSLLPGILCHALWNLSVLGVEYWRLTMK